MNTKTIYPYLMHGVWVFDDEQAGLDAEPFVRGATEMLSALAQSKSIATDGTRVLKLTFSAEHFEGADVCLAWFAEDDGGNWYRATLGGVGMSCWLCPVLFKYFTVAPAALFVKCEDADPIKTHTEIPAARFQPGQFEAVIRNEWGPEWGEK